MEGERVGRMEAGEGRMILLEPLDSAMSEGRRTSEFFRYNNPNLNFGLNCSIQQRILSNIHAYLDNPNVVSSLINV